MQDEQALRPIVTKLARDAAAKLNAGVPNIPAILHFDGTQLAPGYALPNEAMEEATSLCARLEGIIFDPVYTAKTMTALLRQIRDGRFKKTDTIMMIHSGARRLFSLTSATG